MKTHNQLILLISCQDNIDDTSWRKQISMNLAHILAHQLILKSPVFGIKEGFFSAFLSLDQQPRKGWQEAHFNFVPD